MKIRRTILCAVAVAGLHASNGAAMAQGAPPASPDPEAPAVRLPVAAQMRWLFAARLKSDVGLDDAQIASVLPRIEALEQTRARGVRERSQLLRELRRGLASGMRDDELQRRLDALDRVGQETERTSRAALDEVDRDLTVPQRVRLRFLMARFRQEMARRVEEFGRGAPGGAGRRNRSRPGAIPPDPAP